MFESTAHPDFKIYHPADSAFFEPRGNMFMVTSRPTDEDYNIGGTDITAYPTSGINLFPGGPEATQHGIYVQPPPGRVLYVRGLRFAFNITAKALHLEQFKDRISGEASCFELMHGVIPICDSCNLYDITLRSHEAPQEVVDAIASNNYLYGQHWTLDMPGRVDGDVDGAFFGVRTQGGNGVYLGTNFAGNKLTHLHVQITGWVVDKVDIGGVLYDAIPR